MVNKCLPLPPTRCSPKLHPRVRWTRSVNASDYAEHLNVSQVFVVEETTAEKEVQALGTALKMAEEDGGRDKDTVASFSLSVEPSDLTQPAHYTDALLGTSNEPTISSTKTPLSSPASGPLSELYFRAKKYSESKRHFETWAKFIQEEHDGVEVSKILIREEEVGEGRREARRSTRISRSPKRQNEDDEKRKGKNKNKKRRKGKRGNICCSRWRQSLVTFAILY